MEKHTPTPWMKFKKGYFISICTARPVGERIRIAKDLSEQNAEIIVRAVNSHEALLAAARIASDGINTAIDNDEEWNRMQFRSHLFAIQSELEKAIALAEMKVQS